MKERVGIFGGTFDPPHRGHLQVARSACDELELDRLLWIPAGNPPHKAPAELTAAHHRVAMLEPMVAEDVRFELETFEVDRGEVSYTVETLQHLALRHPSWQLVLIMGEDQWDAFDTWVQPDEIREHAAIAVYRREDGAAATDNQAPDPNRPAPDHWLTGSLLPEASTRIRSRIALGASVEDDVLPSIAAYIREHGLYR